MTTQIAPSTRKPRRTTKAVAALTDTYAAAPVAEAITQLEAAIGGRAQLAKILLQADPGTDVAKQESLAYVMGLIADPDHAQVPLAELCRRGRITVGELLAAYKAGAYASLQIALITKASTEIPKVVDDVFARAQVYDATCATCQGTRTVAGPGEDAPPVPCEACGATGLVRVFPDLDRQKLALELAQLTPKKAPLVEQKTLALTAGGGANFAELIAAADGVLHGRGRGAADEDDAEAPPADAIDGDVIDPSEASAADPPPV